MSKDKTDTESEIRGTSDPRQPWRKRRPHPGAAPSLQNMEHTTTPAARFAVVAATLTAAHHVGDYLVQTDHQASRKACAADRLTECTETESWRALAAHVASYHLAQAGALLVANKMLGLRLRPGRVVAGVAFSAATHALIDRRWPVREWMDHTGSAQFRAKGGAPHVDQALHHTALWGSALVMSAPAAPGTS